MLAHIKPLASKISGTFENNRNEYLMSKIIYSQYVKSMFGNMCITVISFQIQCLFRGSPQ